MTTIAYIENLRKKAEKDVPRVFYDYADSASWPETTYWANENDLKVIKFHQRGAIDVSVQDTNM
jgi:L-lactate dehydrogenase (cytochrome)